MIRRLIYVYYLPLSESLERLFFLDHLSSHGVPLEYWDLSAIYQPNAGTAALERPYARSFTTFEDFERRLASEAAEGAAVVAVFPLDPRVYGAFRAFSRMRVPLLAYFIGAQPTVAPEAARRILDKLSELIDPARLLNFLRRRQTFLARRLGLIKDFDLVFAAGDAAAQPVSPSTRIVRINHPDYDDVLRNAGKSAPLVAGDYAVYLDDNLAHHPDLKVMSGLKIKSPLDAGRYYDSLNAFFSRLEAEHRVKIVVAAHPKADYRVNPFDGRLIFQRQTRLLTEHCRFALTTISSSLGYAVLYDKPLLFVTSDDIIDKYAAIGTDVFPRLFAESLGRDCVNLDHAESVDCLRLRGIDRQRYQDYKYRYLVSRQSEGRQSRDICLEEMTALVALAPSGERSL